MVRTFTVVLVCLGAVLTAAPAIAHHAFAAEFDAKRPVKFDSVKVTRMDWVNPHVWIYGEVTRPDGQVERWAFEAGTPNTLFRRGLTKEALKPGTVIVVDGYQAKDGSRRANGRNVTLPNGQTLFLGSSGTGAPAELDPEAGTRIFGTADAKK
jgi:hypothetical protein